MSRSLKLAVLMGLAGMSQVPGASAQTGALALEEIVVTATRRVESILDIPQSIQAIDGALLERLSIGNVEDVVALVPNLNVEAHRKHGGRFNIRGFGDQRGAFTAFSTVGTYVDDTPLTDARANLQAMLFDVDRVEVLRGPQGTLYGESSLAGTVRIITARPDPDELSGSLVARGETTDGGSTGYRFGGVLNAPIAPGIAAFRLSATRDRTGGFMDTAAWPDGTPTATNVNETISSYVRGVVQVNAGDNLVLRPSFTYSNVEGGAGPLDSIALPDFTGYANGPDDFKDTLRVAALELEWELPWATVISSTSYSERRFAAIDDDIGANTVIDLFIAPSEAATQNYERDIDTVTQELRLVSTADGPLTWLAGGFYRRKELTEDVSILSPTIGAIVGDERIFFQENSAKFEQYALFGEVNYAVTERLTLTGGLRWFSEDANSVLQFGVFDLGVFGFVLNPRITPSFSESGTLLKGALTYDLADDVTLYALYSEGYRPGGVNDRLVDLTGALTPEQLQALSVYGRDETKNYEIGLKGRLLDGRLALNISAFRIDWNDTQVATQPIPGANVVVNAKGARSTGFEADFLASLPGNVRVGGAIGYADAEIVADTPSASGLIPRGSSLAHAPLWSANLYLEQLYSLNVGGDLRIRVDGRFTDRRQNTVDVVGQPGTPLAAYTILNASASYERERYTVDLVVNNLTNKRAELNANLFDDPLLGNLIAGYVRNAPRTVGLQLRMNF
jgi:outer membrane receptor protein involved in Fe transport